MSLEKNISRLLSRKDEIEERLSSSSLDTADLMHLSKELSDLRPIAEQAAKVQKLKMGLSDAENLLKDQDADAEMVALAEDEIQEIRPKITEEEYQLKFYSCLRIKMIQEMQSWKLEQVQAVMKLLCLEQIYLECIKNLPHSKDGVSRLWKSPKQGLGGIKRRPRISLGKRFLQS